MRSRMMHDFNTNPDVSLFLLTTKVGEGEGRTGEGQGRGEEGETWK